MTKIYTSIIMFLFLIMTSSCSEEADNKSSINQQTEKIAQESVEYIQGSLEKAQDAVDDINKAMQKAQEQSEQ